MDEGLACCRYFNGVYEVKHRGFILAAHKGSGIK